MTSVRAIAKNAGEAAVAMAAFIVIGHYLFGFGVSVIILKGSPDLVATSLLVNAPVWSAVVFIMVFLSDYVELIFRRRRMRLRATEYDIWREAGGRD